MISINVKSNVEQKLQKMVSSLGRELKDAITAIGKTLVDETQSNLDNKLLHKRSGKLFESVHMTVEETSYGYILTVSSELPYSAIQDLGGSAGKHGSVRIPASGYMTKAAMKLQRQMKQILEPYIAKATS
jgi:phage gpG-like protein